VDPGGDLSTPLPGIDMLPDRFETKPAKYTLIDLE